MDIKVKGIFFMWAELFRRRTKTKRGDDLTFFSIKEILQNSVHMVEDEDAYQCLQSREVDLVSDRKAFDGVHGMMVYNRTDRETGKAMDYLPMTEWIVAVGKYPGIIPAK